MGIGVRAEKLPGRGRLVGNMVRAGVERSMVQLKKSKLSGTEKTGGPFCAGQLLRARSHGPTRPW